MVSPLQAAVLLRQRRKKRLARSEGVGVPASAPENTVLPGTPTGTAEIGETLTSPDTGTWTGSPEPTYARQWFRADPTYSSQTLVMAGGDIVYTDVEDIAGETGATYVLAAADANKVVGVKVTATNDEGSDTVLSFVTGVVLDPAAADYIARVSVMTDFHETVYNTLLLTLRTGGVLAKGYGLYCFHAANSQAALENLVAANEASLVGAPAFTAFSGFAGNGSDTKIDTGLSADGGPYTQDNGSLGVWALTTTEDWQPMASSLDAGVVTAVTPFIDGQSRGKINSGTNSGVTKGGAGWYMVNRLVAGTQRLYLDKVGTDFAVASTTTAASNFAFLGDTYGSSSNSIAFGWVGQGLSPTEEGVLYDALFAFQTALVA